MADEYDNFCMIKENDAEVLIEILTEYPQAVRWTIKGVNVANLRERLITQLKRTREQNAFSPKV